MPILNMTSVDEKFLVDLFVWLTRHYEREESPGETDRPEYIELRELLARVDLLPAKAQS